MAEYYSGTVQDVQTVLRNVRVGGNRIDDISPADVEKFQKLADSIINGSLSPLFRVPLFKILRDGVREYPQPIQYIAQRIVASLVQESVYSEIEPNKNEVTASMGSEARGELNDLVRGILKGSRVLEGQKIKARNRFVNPRAAPHETPPDRDKL
jgi:hypothetical protein